MAEQPQQPRASLLILVAAILLAAAGAYAYYRLLDTPAPFRSNAAISLTFLLLVPAALAAFASFLSDRGGTRGLGHHLKVPLLLIGAVLLLGVVILREGVICILLLLPLWLPAAIAGSLLTYVLGRRIRERGRLFCSALLLLPIAAHQVEGQFPPSPEAFVVTRAVVIDAPVERVWPLLVAIPDIGPTEGRWNAAQDLLGIPRPVEARMERRGRNLVRKALWESGVRFEEHITLAEPGRALQWNFAFPDESVREHTDRHVAPDGAHLRVERGGYRMERAPGNRTRLVLETRYVLQTPLNPYAAWWGDLLLGGIQENVLAIVKQRAET